MLLLIGVTLGLAARIPWVTLGHLSSSEHTAPTIEQVQALAELVTAKVQISDVQETKLKGYLGGVQAILMIKGEALLGPNLSKARIVRVDAGVKRIEIELPAPHVICCRLNHNSTKVFALSHSGLWTIVPGDAGRTRVLNDAFSQAEKALESSVTSAGLLDVASKHAEQALAVFFATTGWKISVNWRSGL